MRLTYFSGMKGYEPMLCETLRNGAARIGVDIDIVPTSEYAGPVGDAGIICGVSKREILWDYQKRGAPFVFLDKGFWRTRAPWRGGTPPGWWRAIIGDSQPTTYFQRQKRPDDRWKLLDVELAERRTDGRNIVIAASSHKYHLTYGLPDPTEWVASLVAEIRRHTDRPIVYRPKPSWGAAVPVEGTIFDHQGKSPFSDVLRDAWCVVTYGSMACVEAIASGIPCIVLGNAVARPIASTDVADIEAPLWVGPKTRRQWASDLAYCHWRLAELDDGTAWRTIMEELHAVAGV
jgi:hypothetical protein